MSRNRRVLGLNNSMTTSNNATAERSAETPDWSSHRTTLLDDFEELLEAAERVTKSSAQSGQTSEFRADANGEIVQLAARSQAE